MKRLLLPVLLLCVISLIVCSKKKSHEEKSISGNVFIIDAEGNESPYSDEKIQDKVRIKTKENGNIEIPIDPSRKLFLNENTTITLDIEKSEDGSLGDINITLIKGEALIINNSKDKAFSLTSDAASIIGNLCSFNTIYYPKQNVIVIKSFDGNVKIFPTESHQLELEKCNKLLIKSNKDVSNTISITMKDIEEINSWLPKDENLSATCDEDKKEVVINKKPEWIGQLKLKANENEIFIDTAKVKDPEGKMITFYVSKGPKGFLISKNSGVITYKKPIPGTYRINIVAQDEDGESSVKNYFLTVPGKIQALIDAPERVVLKSKVKIDASESRNSLGETKNLLFRFDANGDNKWDNQFNNINFVEVEFSKPGKYKVRVEVKDKNNKVSKAETFINVVKKINAKLSHSPSVGKVGSEFKINVEISDISNIGVRWDLNNDGKWDIPSSGEFGSTYNVKNIYDKKGSHIVRVEIKNDLQSITLFDTISIYDGIVIDSIKSRDTISVNEKIKIKCYARDEKNKIVEYAWDFAGVGLFDKKGINSEVETSYKKSGIYSVVCAVTNNLGMTVSDIKEIIVLNKDATVAAGGPYSSTVNKEILVRGMGRDPDNKIIEYLWDLNNDGKFEIKSSSSTQTKVKFSKSGDHNIVFGIVTDDGKKIFDTTFVKVSNRAPHAEAGDDIVSRPGKKVKLNGIGKDPDNNVKIYEWDFNEDGKFDFSSTDSGYAEFKFEKFTKAIFKVTDTEGLSSTDTVRIVICPKDMITNEEGKFCIDKYEYPNIRKKSPVTNLTYNQAKKECESKGKRLCAVKELKLACNNGNDRFNYPYGKKYEEYNCNTVDSKKTKNRKSWSGQYTLCVTKDGVFDMTGNVAEWAADIDGKYGYAVGGWWQDGRDQATCGKFVKIKKDKGYGHVGLRCCK